METGGAAGSLAALDRKLPHNDIGKIHGHFLTRQRFGAIYASLDAGREAILTPGLEIYQEILATIGGEGMMVSEAGLLEGILLSIMRGYRS